MLEVHVEFFAFFLEVSGLNRLNFEYLGLIQVILINFNKGPISNYLMHFWMSSQ